MNEPVTRDPGLQPERTLLAWRRTALALVAVAAVATRWLAVELGPLAGAVSAVAIVLAAIALASAQLRYRRVVREFAAADARERPLPRVGTTIALVGGATILVGVAGVALVVALSLETV